MNYLADHQTFTTKHELNEAVNEHITANNHELNATDRDVLLAISRHAVKFPGAAHLKAETLARIVSKSTITVRRAIKKLVRLQIIEKRPFIRKVKKGSGANLLLILPFNDNPEVITRPEAEKPVPTRDEQPKSENEPISFKTLNTLLKTLRKETRLGYSFTPKNVPETFINAVKPFFDEAAEIYRLWGKAVLVHKKFNLNHVLEEYTDMAIEAFKQSVYAYKHRKIRKDFNGYFYGTLLRMFAYKKREETFASHPSIFNWLEDQGEESADWQQEVKQLMEREDREVMFMDEDIPY